MPLPQQGLSKDDLFARLQEFKKDDLPWRTGRVLGFNYKPDKEAEEVVSQAYLSFLGENALDPTSFPSILKMENEVVRTVADLLRGGPEAVGNFTSGGTESILLAVKTARDYSRAHKPHIKEPEMVVCRTAHGAFFKAAHYFGIKLVVTPFDPVTFQADVAAMEAAITPNTILLVASAPGYAQGVVDPVGEIGQVALKHNLLFHVDGCVGGIHLSFMRLMGMDVPDFDFSVPGVTSMSADMHKYGYAAKGASVVIHKNKDLRKYQIFAVSSSNIYALVNPTVLSSRSGGPVAGAWAVLNFLGFEGYQKIIADVQAATARLTQGINATGDLRVLGKPNMCMFSFASDTLNVYQLADVMRKKGWYLQPQFSTGESPINLHISVNASTVPVVEDFLKDLTQGVEETKALKMKLDARVVRQQVQHLIANMPGDPVENLKAMAGLGGGGGLPEDSAMINLVLDALPRDLTDAMLVEFFNNLYV